MKIFAFIIFAICLIASLVFSYLGKKLAQNICKPLMLLAVIFVDITLGVKNPFIYIALGFGVVGDIFLCFDLTKKKYLIPGSICFVLNHSFFIAGFVYSLEVEIPLILIIAYILVFIFFAFFLKKPLEKYLGKLAPFVSSYTGLLAIEFMFSIFFFIVSARYTYLIAFVPFIGTVLYICADLFLVKTTFVSHKKNEDLITLSTYGLAQLLLSIGIGLY